MEPYKYFDRATRKFMPTNGYMSHRNRAFHRGIEFLLTIEEWTNIWMKSGHWNEAGTRKGQYVMARIHDKGPYAVGNVKIIKTEDNISEVPFNKLIKKNDVIAKLEQKMLRRRTKVA